MKVALIFGATGFIGSHLLNEILQSADYYEVIVVVRKPIRLSHPKLRVLIADYKSLDNVMSQIKVDEVFIALGTTKKKTPNKTNYYQIDHDYPVVAARMAKEKGAKSVFIVTAIGANAGSAIFYTRTKGETERDILRLDFEHTHIFQPSMILGDREEHRPLEKVFMTVSRLVNPLLQGSLKQYRGIDGQDVAKAMVAAAKCQSKKIKYYRWAEMANRS